MKNVLCLENVDVGYFKRQVLRDVCVSLRENTTGLLVGPNGAGKSTVFKTIMGMLKPWKGKVIFNGQEMDGLSPARRSKMGMGYFLQGGETFVNLDVIENLQIAGGDLGKKLVERIDAVFELFPKLGEMRTRRAGLLSGGEKHQLALGMIFIRQPKLMLLDEPSAGLSPRLVKEFFLSIKKMKEILNTSIFLVEQNVTEGFKITDTVFLMKAGSIVGEATPQEVVSQNLLEQLFFENL